MLPNWRSCVAGIMSYIHFTDIQGRVKLYYTVSKLAYISFRLIFDHKEPEDVAELEDLRSWDHELHFTDVQNRVKLYYTLSKLAYISNTLE